MPSNPDSSEPSKPPKCTLSTKAATNGDPQVEHKWLKLNNSQTKLSTLMTLTKKQMALSSKAPPAKAAAIAAKATAMKQQVAKLAP